MVGVGQRLRSGGIWVFAIKMAAMLASLSVNIVLARILSPDDVGAYFAIFSLVSVLTVVAQLGLQRAVVRFAAQARARRNTGAVYQVVGAVLLHGTLAGSFVAVVLLIGGGRWLSDSVLKSPAILDLVGIIGLWVVAQTVLVLTAESLRGLANVPSATFFRDLIFSLLFLVVLVVLWTLRNQWSLTVVIPGATIAAYLALALALGTLWRALRPYAGREQVSYRSIYSVALPLWGASLLAIMFGNGEIWLLSAFRSPSDVAVFGAALRLAVLVAVPLTITNAVVPPLIVELSSTGNRKELERTLRSIASMTSLLSLAMAIVFWALAGQILSVVYGEFYAAGAVVLVLLVFGQFLNVISGSCGLTLMLTGHQILFFVISALSGSALIGGLMIFVPQYGPTGAAFVSATVLTLQNALMVLAVRKKLGIWVHASLDLKASFQFLLK